MLIFFSIVFIIYFMNKAALRTAKNIEDEKFVKELNRKLIQNAKLDELYGRDPGNPIQQINKAAMDVTKDQRKNNSITN